MHQIWFVRAGRDSIYAEDFVQHKVVAIGWPELGELEKGIPKAKLLEVYRRVYPDHPEGRAQVAVSQIIRFMQELKVGDAVMTYERDTQLYYLGVIASGCQWEPNIVANLPRVRHVEWNLSIARNILTPEAKNALGAIQTLFLVRDKTASEINEKAHALQQPTAETVIAPLPTSEQAEVEREVLAELLEKSEQGIEDRIVRLEWDQMQELVAGILRAMNYRTTVSPRGSDRGVDIFASPDGLGLEEPRIFVEVKHRPTTTMGSQDLRSFLGGRSPRDKCLPHVHNLRS